jgi:beta-lactamase regulating signal transducer with metallopeptidase domain
MASQIAQWLTPFDLFIAIGIGAAAIVTLAAIAVRWCRATAALQVAVWRIATVSMFLLVALELTGFGRAFGQLGGQWFASRLEANRREDSAGETIPRRFDEPDPKAFAVSASTALAAPPSGGLAADSRLKPELQRDAKPELEHSVLSTQYSVLPPPPPSQANWPLAIWIAVTLSALCWLIAARIAAGRFRRSCLLMNDGDLYERVTAMRTKLLIQRPVVLLSSTRTASPLVFGGRRPALVLPVSFAQDFNRQQQDAILAHELAHLAAGDANWQTASHVLCVLLWWHPLAWWSRRQLRAAHEAAADEGCLIVPDGPRVLAEALVALGERLMKPQPSFGLSLGGGHFRSGLGRRVQRLLNLPRRSWRRPRRTRMAFVHFLLPALVTPAALFIGTAWAPSQAPTSQGETTMSIFATSWRGSLLATALCAVLGNSPAPAAADDELAAPPAATDRDKLIREKFRAAREKAAQLDEQGKHDEADRIRREIKEAMSKVGSAPHDPRADHASAVREGNDDPRAKVKRMIDMADKLQQDGFREQADSIRRAAKELHGKMSEPHTPSASNATPDLIRERLRTMEDKLAAAKQDGNEEQARRMSKELDALRARLRQTPSRLPENSKLADPASQEFAQRIKDISRHIEELEKVGKHDQVDQLRKERELLLARQKELYSRSLGMIGTAQLLPPPVASPEQEKIRDYLRAMEDKMEAVRKTGNEEQIRAAQKEMEVVRERLREREAVSRAQASTAGGDPFARMKHLRVAAENLKAAGCEPEAKHVMDMISHIEAETRASAAHDRASAATAADVTEAHRQIEDMRREMQSMRDEMQRLKSLGR